MKQPEFHDLVASYSRTMRAYEDEFDSRMAEVCIQLLLLHDRLNLPYKRSIFTAALEVIRDCESVNGYEQSAMEVKSAILWWAYNGDRMYEEIENLL